MTRDKVPTAKKIKTLARLLPWIKPQFKLFMVIIGLVLLINAAELIKPYILKLVIDDHLRTGIQTGDMRTVTMLSLAYLASIAASSGLSYLQAILVTRMGQSILMDIRREVYRHILRLPMRILNHYSSGRLITRATNDIETLNGFFTDVLISLFKDVFMLVGIIATMLLLDWRLALIAFLTVPLIVLVTLLVRKRLRKNFLQIKHLIGSINAFFAENIAGMRLIQIFTREKQRQADLDKINDEYCKANLIQIRLNSLLRPIMEIINTLGIVLLIRLSFPQLAGGTLEIGLLYAFTTYIRQFFEPINDLAENYATIQSASVSADRIFELLDNKDDLEDLESGDLLGEVKGRIEFRQVWFAYKDEDWILRDLSFVLEPGVSAAIVGPTGTGKTTIIALLLRFYDVQRGEILLDGRDIRSLNIHDLRRRIAIVLQDVFLFSGSIAENIRLGDDQIDEVRVAEALRLAQADDFIDKLEYRMETPVSERGGTFSAGQRQLLSFARAIARKPALFILDEATAHIDSETERRIQQSIEQISRGCTTIIIAHRLSTIRSCDTILVLDEGQLAEQGNHDQLMALNGQYAQMITSLENEIDG